MMDINRKEKENGKQRKTEDSKNSKTVQSDQKIEEFCLYICPCFSYSAV